MESLLVVETHPIQYHAPVYRVLQQQFGIPVTAIYGSDFSIVGYRDREFNADFAWDTDLLSGYTSIFLSHVARGGAASMEKVSAHGLRKHLLDLNPQAILIVGYHSFFHQAAFHHSRKLGCPILFRGDTADHAVKRGLIKTWLRDRTLKWFYSKCERLLYISQRSFEHFRRLGCPEEKLIFSPYCVDISSFRCVEKDREELRPLVRKQLGIDETELAILFSGKLIPRKGPDLLIEAVKNLPPKLREKTVLIFMGDGKLRRQLEQLSSGFPAKNIHFIGFQNQTTLSPYYHAADLFVLPSRSEVWGVVVNEALHHGLPCVVSQGVGAAPDLIEPGVTGEIFETNSPESLALALQRALHLAGRLEIRQKCRQKMEGYTIHKAAEGIARAFHEVVGVHAG